MAAAGGKYFVYISEVPKTQGKFALRPARRRGQGGGERPWRQPRGKEKAAAAPRLAINAHSASVYIVVSVLAGSSVRGGAGTRSGAATSSLLCFLCCYLFGGDVLGTRLPVAELRPMWFLFGPKPRAAFFCASAGLVSPASSPSSPLPRQFSATRSEVGGRGREGGGGRNLGIYLIRSQQPGPDLYSSVVFDSKREKKKNHLWWKDGAGGVGWGVVHFSWWKMKENIFRVCMREQMEVLNWCSVWRMLVSLQDLPM